MTEILEGTIEDYFLRQMTNHGVLCLKFISPGNAGVPDRLLLKAPGIVGFAELKRPGEKPRPLQMRWILLLRKMKFPAYVVSNKIEADEAVRAFAEYNPFIRKGDKID